ncbi:MAG: hypothetical protein JXN61_07065 [Sedimentisphaerales bacterium]|nr:hypothetical protein [Sedimentisphaerales bacterium]
MSNREKDETLVRQTVSRLLDFHGVEVAKESVRQDAAGSLRAPKLEHLELGNPVAVVDEAVTDGMLDDWAQPTEHLRRRLFAPRLGVNPARQKKMAMLIPLLSIVLLVILNKFHGVPLLGSEWLRLGTYETMVGDIVKSGFSATEDDGDHPVRLKVRGIAFSHDRPSAVIGTTIVHEGDVVLGATVVEISRGSVEFEVNGQTWTQKVQ